MRRNNYTRLYIIKKFDLFDYSFDVKDQNNTKLYKIKTLLTLFKIKSIITDMNGKEVICIEKKKTFLPSYSVFINDSFVFDIKLEPTFQKSVYLLSNGYRVEGDARELNHTLYDENNQVIAKMTKSLLNSNRKSEIDIIDVSKTEIALAVAKVVSLPFRYNNSTD